MSAEYSFSVDPARDLVRIRMGGLFTPAEIEAFGTARSEAHRQLRCAPNAHLTITDLRGMKIQPQDSVAGFQAMLGAPEYRSRKLVFVIGQTLARSQLLRALRGRGAQCFDTVEEAEAWLFEAGAAAAA